MIRSAVLIQYTRVTDRQTDGPTDRRTELAWHTRYSIYAVARKNGSGIRIPKCVVVHSMPVSDANLDHLRIKKTEKSECLVFPLTS